MSDPKTALDTLAREELGLDPDELGSPLKAAISSFIAFATKLIASVVPRTSTISDGSAPMSEAISRLASSKSCVDRAPRACTPRCTFADALS